MGFFWQANSGSGKLFICSNSNYDAAFTTSDAKITSQNNGNVGIGTAAPTQLLHVYEGDATAPTDANTHAVIESDSHSYLGLYGGTGSDVGIHFGDTAIMGRVAYENDNNAMTFTTNGAERMRIASTGDVGIGTTSSISRIHTKSTYISETWGSSYWSQSNLVSWNASQVNDGNTGTVGFHTDTSGAGAYARLDCGVGNEREFIRVAITGQASSYAIWDVEYRDGTSGDWTTVRKDLGGHPQDSTTKDMDETWANQGKHRFWQIIKTDEANGGNYHYEIQFYERASLFTAENDTGEVFKVSSNGYVTTPKNPAFSAWFATSWDGSGYLNTNSFTEFFDTTNSMTHGSSARWKYTAPVAGIYFVSMSIMSDSGGSDRLETFIEKNGATQFAGNATSEDYTNSVISGVVQMATNDYLWFKKSGTQGYASQNNAHYVSVCLIG